MTDHDPTPPPARRRTHGPGFAATMLAVVLTAGAAIALNEAMRHVEQPPPPSAWTPTQPLVPAQVGAPFDLIDQDRRPVSDRSFAGRKRLMIFAATADRDRTLAALQVINAARDLAGSAAAELACIWITTDPDRDTPERLAALLAQTSGGWTALTGPPAEVRALMRAHFVPDPQQHPSSRSTRGAPPAAAIIAYLMDEKGMFLSHRTLPPDPVAVAQWLTQSH